MSVALYRKYRPKNFSDVTNQTHIKITLQHEIESDHLGHAYLFCGPRGTGKTTLARLLAKAVNCLDLKENAEPCNECASCQEILENRSLDIIEIDAASHTGVDNVRENIINNARFTPVKSKYKVFIIDEVHMLSISAFNALLKVLEEPPKHVIFILATTEAHKIPATIISRCQRFDFKKIFAKEMVARLRWIVSQEGMKVDEDVLEQIAKHAGGCVRDAESLLEQILSLGGTQITAEQASLILPRSNLNLFFDLFSIIVNKQKAEALAFVNKLLEDGMDLNQFTDNFIEFLRQLLVYKVTNNPHDLARDFDDDLVSRCLEILKKVEETQIIFMINRFLTNKDLFKQNYLVQLPLEVSLIELCGVGGRLVAATPAIKKSEPTPQPVIETPKIETPVVVGPTVDKVEPAITNFDAGDLDQFLNYWQQILSQIKEQHYSLYMSLHMSKPLSFAEDKLILGFIFELQRSRVDDIKAKNIIKEVLLKCLGRKIEVETMVDPKLTLTDLPKNGNLNNPIPTQPQTVDDAANELAGEFGGQVVG